MDDLRAYLSDISRISRLDDQEERTLGWRIINDDDADARNRMIAANLRLVVSICLRYRRRGLSLNDLIEDGNLGLIRAVEKFDPARGVRFATYAVWWIKAALKQPLASGDASIHVPVYMVEHIRKVRSMRWRLHDELGRSPTPIEVAEACDLPDRHFKIAEPISRQQTFGSEAPGRGGHDARPTIDTLTDRHAFPTEPVDRCEMYEAAINALGEIDERDASVLKMRLGFHGQEPMTLDKVSRIYGVSKERVRQMEQRALSKIRRRICG